MSLYFTTVAMLAILVASFGDVVNLILANPQLVGALLGLATPALVEAIKQPTWSVRQRRFLAYGASGLVGLGTVIATGAFDLADLTSTLLLTIATSQASYAELWRPSGAAGAIAAKTTIGGPAATEPVDAEPAAQDAPLLVEGTILPQVIRADHLASGKILVGALDAGKITVGTVPESSVDGV